MYASVIIQIIYIDSNLIIADLSPLKVRRKCYHQNSPAGKGVKWEWGGGEGGSEWLTHDMEVQCLIEESWASVSNFIYFS